jgi:hypothetical protein
LRGGKALQKAGSFALHHKRFSYHGHALIGMSHQLRNLNSHKDDFHDLPAAIESERLTRQLALLPFVIEDEGLTLDILAARRMLRRAVYTSCL